MHNCKTITIGNTFVGKKKKICTDKYTKHQGEAGSTAYFSNFIK